MRIFRHIVFAGAGLTWLPWHEEWVRGVYGPVDLETGLRTVTESFTQLGKKNGKSTFLGALPLVHLAYEDVEIEPRAYGAATTVRQANEVFDAACFFVEKVPEFKKRFSVIRSTRRIIRLDRPTWAYEVLTSEGRNNDGIKVSLGIIDEIHQFRTEAERLNVSAVRRGTRGRRQPLTAIITTAGDPHTSEEWFNTYTFAKLALQNPSAAPWLHVFIREADAKRIQEDPEYWKSKEARLAANPSHEDFGGYIKDSELVRDLERAISIPSEYRSYCRFTLNVASQADDQWIPYREWVECGEVPQRPLLGRDCIVGLDLSVTTDLTALAAVFPDDEGGYDLKVWCWMPSAAIAERERRDRKPYGDWIRNGYIEATEGDAVNLQAVRDRLHWLRENCNVVTVAYDPAHAQKLITELAYEDGFTCEKQVQSGAKFSASMRHLNDVILARKLRHGGDNPVLNWMAQCVVGKVNPREEVHIAKPDRRKETTRVDGISATVTALCSAMAYREQGLSISYL